MAKQGELVAALFLVLLISTALAVSRVEGMTAVLMNKMKQDVGITCSMKDRGRDHDFGYRSVTPGLSYLFEIPDETPGSFAGLKYTCMFATIGKPQMILDVFVGTGGVNNEPCECHGDFCPWSITNAGFSCNFNQFSHPWGN